MTSATIVAMIAAVAAPLGAYLLAARRFSGKIETSDARELWAESRAIRDWSMGRIQELNELVRRLEERIKLLEEDNKVLTQENRGLLLQIAKLEEKTR